MPRDYTIKKFLSSILLTGLILSLGTACDLKQQYPEATFQSVPGVLPSITVADLNSGFMRSWQTEQRKQSAAEIDKLPSVDSDLQDSPALATAYEKTLTQDPERKLDKERLGTAFQAVVEEMQLEGEDYAFAFLLFETGELWGINVDKAYNAASTIKIASALYTYEQAALGNCHLAERVIIEAEDLELGTGPISAAGTGAEYSLEELLAASIMHSDNTAFHAIYHYWQGRTPEGWLVLSLDRRYALHYNGTQELSPRECIGMLRELYVNPGQVPGYKQLEYYMQNTSYEAMAAAYLPVPVARKYGKLGGLYHDIGIVYGEHPFAFAIFTNGLSRPQESIAKFCLAFYQELLN